jgi:hypothetical protein
MSSDSDSARFQKLNDTNYAQWAIMMEAELVRKDLWTDIVEVLIIPPSETGDAGFDDNARELADKDADSRMAQRSLKSMAQARAEMILRVEGSQLSHMTSKDPLEIWETLKRVHQSRGFATSLALRRKFLTAAKQTSQSMQAWIGYIRQLAYDVEQVTDTLVPDQDIILALTLGLPSSYDNVVIGFDATPSDQLTLDLVITRLLNEETRQTSKSRSRAPAADKGPNEAMGAIPAKKASKTTNGRPICYYCQTPGHIASNCEKRRQEWGKTASTSSSVEHASAVEDIGISDDEAY